VPGRPQPGGRRPAVGPAPGFPRPAPGVTPAASLGAGAFLDGAPIAPSAKTNLAAALVGTSHPPFVAAQPEAVAATGRAVSVLLPAVGAHRNLGPTSWQVADVASGRLNAFWQYGRDPGNLLAGSLVAAEAGVVVTDMDGEPWRADSAGFLAAPARLHGQLLELFAKARSWEYGNQGDDPRAAPGGTRSR
jgi:myo-inositol-1(or 4)-monophosphatase